MLTIEQYNKLSYQEQLDYIWENCLFLESRWEGGKHIVKLYHVGLFFVEIRFYNPDDFQVIHVFDRMDLLFPYVEQIDLRELLKYK